MEPIEKIIQDLELRGFSLISDLVSSEELQAMAPLFSKDFSQAKVGHASAAVRADEIRGDSTLWLDPAHPPKELQRLVTFLGDLKGQLNETCFTGLKDFECHLSKYPVGGFYKKHLDRFAADSSRSISFIFYLHDEWTNKDGGELILYNQSNEVLEMILPKPGSLVVFQSEKFPHEVKPCERERRSLTGWMHTKLLT